MDTICDKVSLESFEMIYEYVLIISFSPSIWLHVYNPLLVLIKIISHNDTD